ncbi:hypothetical protein SAMN05216466_10748 [Paraburkholderia phenazinium]|uniref:Lipoprotein n=1 Tax=Paraburkholderia phenazinium TaxID=60549 RepID=A0A1G7ZIS1_9BURK|nr:hypothetical protein [Paraburkholderia phenazinium]SDH08598.1 hypothetical protein SAMN05216466_10748 [Paraburkholderia phenazinium]
MFRTIAVVLAGAVAFAFAGCSAPQQAQVLTVAQQVNAQITKVCDVYNPIAADVTALYPTVTNPDVALGMSAVAGLCANNAAINVTSLQTISQTVLPAAVKGLATAGLSAADQTKLGNLLTIANLAVAAAYAAYGTPTAAAAPAASAPVAASQ